MRQYFSLVPAHFPDSWIDFPRSQIVKNMVDPRSPVPLHSDRLQCLLQDAIDIAVVTILSASSIRTRGHLQRIRESTTTLSTSSTEPSTAAFFKSGEPAARKRPNRSRPPNPDPTAENLSARSSRATA